MGFAARSRPSKAVHADFHEKFCGFDIEIENIAIRDSFVTTILIFLSICFFYIRFFRDNYFFNIRAERFQLADDIVIATLNAEYV